MDLGLSLKLTRRGGGGGAPAAFSPDDLFGASEAGGWWQADEIATLWQDSARTTQVTAAADPVGAWDTKVNSTNFLQATSAKRATYRTGLPRLEFDGIDDVLEAAFTLSAASTWTFGLSYSPTTPDSMLCHRNASGNFLFAAQSGSVTTTLHGNITSASAWFDNTLFTGTNRGAVHTAKEGANTAIAEFVPSVNWDNFALGKYLTFGFNTYGDIYAAVLINRSLTSGERGDLHTWLLGKAGL